MLSVSHMPVHNSFDDLLALGSAMDGHSLAKCSSLSNITATLDIDSLGTDLQALLDGQATGLSDVTPFCRQETTLSSVYSLTPAATAEFTSSGCSSSSRHHAPGAPVDHWCDARYQQEIGATPLSGTSCQTNTFANFSSSGGDLGHRSHFPAPITSAPSSSVVQASPSSCRISSSVASSTSCGGFPTNEACLSDVTSSLSSSSMTSSMTSACSLATSLHHSSSSAGQSHGHGQSHLPREQSPAQLVDNLLGQLSESAATQGMATSLASSFTSSSLPMGPSSPSDFLSESSELGTAASAGCEAAGGSLASEVMVTDHEILHPRVLDKEESAQIRKLRSAKREVKRLRLQKEAFERLSHLLPYDTRRMSRLDLLRKATEYIGQLKSEVAHHQTPLTIGPCDNAPASPRPSFRLTDYWSR